MKPEPIAILCSDIHLTLRQPPCRADDWMEVQRNYLVQVKSLACTVKERWLGNRNTTGRPVPVLCAGDIFDKWNPPPELIRFALEHLPNGMICIPGQHDLPEHRFDQIHRSAYGCLREAGKIRCAATHRRNEVPSRGHIWLEENWAVYGFAWGETIEPPLQEKSVALCHQYIWRIGHSYQGAPAESHVERLMKPLKRYKVAVFGDNHDGFEFRTKLGTYVLNCGGFIIRKSDEIGRRPRVGILHADGSVKIHELDTSKDEFRTPEEMAEVAQADMAGFIDEMARLGEHGLDYRESVRIATQTMDLPEPVKEKVLMCLAEDKGTA